MSPVRGMDRRHWLALLAGLLAAPAGANAPRRVGIATNVPLSSDLVDGLRVSFSAHMRKLGWIEGQNVETVWRSSDGHYERIPKLVEELLALKVDVLVSFNTLATLEAKRQTDRIPIVFATVDDPVGLGLVHNLARPEANVTGFSGSTDHVLAKQLDILLAAVPGLSRIALLRNPDNVRLPQVEEELRSNMKSRKMAPMVQLWAKDWPQLEAAFDTARKAKVQAVMVMEDGFFISHRRQIAELALRSRLPTIAKARQFAEAGITFSYGRAVFDDVELVAGYVDKLFNGANPASLPVHRPSTFPFVINGKAAKAIGLKLPEDLLIRADEVMN